MQCYSDDRAFNHFLLDPMKQPESTVTQTNDKNNSQAIQEEEPIVSFKGVDSINDFVKHAVIAELLASEKITSNVFVSQI